MKQCTKCKSHKATDHFNKNKASPDGFSCWCKLCYRAKYKEDNKDRIEAKNKRVAANKEKTMAAKIKRIEAKKLKAEAAKERTKLRDATYYQKNKERINARQRAWDAANLDRRRERDAARREIIREQRNAYYKENKDQILKARRIARRLRRKTDPTFKLEENLRARTNIAIKNNSKSESTFELLGSTVEHARKHLESQFTKGMSWKTYGLYGWHIDHIIPCDSFDLSIKEHRLQCFHFTNLQPLWAKDNLSKSNKLPDQHQPQLPIHTI